MGRGTPTPRGDVFTPGPDHRSNPSHGLLLGTWQTGTLLGFWARAPSWTHLDIQVCLPNLMQLCVLALRAGHRADSDHPERWEAVGGLSHLGRQESRAG